MVSTELYTEVLLKAEASMGAHLSGELNMPIIHREPPGRHRLTCCRTRIPGLLSDCEGMLRLSDESTLLERIYLSYLTVSDTIVALHVSSEAVRSPGVALLIVARRAW